MRLFSIAAILSLSVSPSVLGQVAVEIEVNDSATADDDYFCWTPQPARIRLTTPAEGDVPVVLSGLSVGTGQLAFGYRGGEPPAAASWVGASEIEVTLASNGAWVPFLVAGTNASTDAKDVAIVAADAASGEQLGAIDVMVRVRKNADDLTASERDRFLDALATLNDHANPLGPSSAIEKYAEVHEKAFKYGIHDGELGQPLFLAWHRAFVLSFERELQAIDKSVALPYWLFDEPSANIFTPDFMGFVSGDISKPNATLVQFAGTNSLDTWRTPGMATLTRGLKAQDAALGADVALPGQLYKLGLILTQPTIGDYQNAVDPTKGANNFLEDYYHNGAHNSLNGGAITSRASPRDPLFFLLHANVDRAFAEWQVKFDRFDSTLLESYPLQGTFAASTVGETRQRKGSFALDPMWPWSMDNGSATADEGDNWPTPGFPMLAAQGFGPTGVPTPASMVDYLGALGTNDAIGACYDDLRYGPGV